MDIALNPDELARVRLSITSADNEVRVSILTERPETLEFIRRNIDQLSQELRQLGYQSAHFSFNSEAHDQTKSAAQSPVDEVPNGEGDEHAANQIIDLDTLNTGPMDGLDLRI